MQTEQTSVYFIDFNFTIRNISLVLGNWWDFSALVPIPVVEKITISIIAIACRDFKAIIKLQTKLCVVPKI